MRCAFSAEMTSSGDDSSNTGSSAQAAMVHTDTISTPAKGATNAGANSGPRQASAINLRSGAAGHNVSASAARLGRAASSTSATGTAT
jgi:hypothetical protein